MDKIRKVTREYRANQWMEIVKERQSRGMTIKGWCDFHGVNEKSFYYWQRKLRETVCEVMEKSTALTFAEVNIDKAEPVKGFAASIRIGDVTAEIHNGAEADTVETVIRTLKTLC